MAMKLLLIQVCGEGKAFQGICKLHFACCVGNGIGADGAKALGKALETNSSVTSLDLQSMLIVCPTPFGSLSYMVVYDSCLLEMVAAMVGISWA